MKHVSTAPEPRPATVGLRRNRSAAASSPFGDATTTSADAERLSSSGSRFVTLPVEGDAALVVVVVGEEQARLGPALTGTERRDGPHPVACRQLHLDHIGAQIRQELAAIRPPSARSGRVPARRGAVVPSPFSSASSGGRVIGAITPGPEAVPVRMARIDRARCPPRCRRTRHARAGRCRPRLARTRRCWSAPSAPRRAPRRPRRTARPGGTPEARWTTLKL